MPKPYRHNDNFLAHTQVAREGEHAESESALPDDLGEPLGALRQAYDAKTAEEVSAVLNEGASSLRAALPVTSMVLIQYLAGVSCPKERRRLSLLAVCLRLTEWCAAGKTPRSRSLRVSVVLSRVDGDYTLGTYDAEIARAHGVSREAVRKHAARFNQDFPNLAGLSRKKAASPRSKSKKYAPAGFVPGASTSRNNTAQSRTALAPSGDFARSRKGSLSLLNPLYSRHGPI